VVAVLFKRRRRILQVFAAQLVVVVIALLVRRPEYEAEASVLVKYGREYVNRPEVGQERSLVTLTPEEVLNSELQILTSEDLLREVVEAVGAARLYPGLLGRAPTVAEAARRFRKALDADAVKRSSVLRVAFRHPDPRVAADALHVLLDRYQQKHLQAFGEGSLDFVQQQLRTYEDRLHESERRLEEFRQSSGVFAYDHQMRLLLERRADLAAQHRQAGVELAELERRISAQRQALEGPSPNEVVMDVERDLIRARGDVRSRRARLASVSRLIDEVDGQIRALDAHQLQLAALQRQAAQDERNFATYRAKVDEMVLASAMNRQRLSNVSVIDAGAVPSRPANSRLGLPLALGLALSVLGALLYGVVAERLGQTLSTPEAVERRLDIPVLASVHHHA
jgi:uncharacterized protein involved in exopolysaccharide biosynthesis